MKEHFSKLEEQVTPLTNLVTKLVEGATSKSSRKQTSASSSKKRIEQELRDETDEEEEEEEEVEQTTDLLLGVDQDGEKPFRVDFKLEIPTYDGDVNVEKLDNWIDQMENYFTLCVYISVQKISLA